MHAQRIQNGKYIVEIAATESGEVKITTSQGRMAEDASSVFLTHRQGVALGQLLLDAAARAKGFAR